MDKLKDIIRCISLLAIGLLISLVVYPAIHEISHCVIATILGAKVINVNVFSSPHILCDMRNIDDIRVVFIGLSGMIFPFVISIFIELKKFWLWYANYIIVGISTLSFAIAIVSVFLFIAKIPMQNDDITQILMLYPDSKWFVLVAMILFFIIGVIKLLRVNIFKKCVEHFIY